MQRLQIETPEHVILDFEVAGVGSRALAAVIDSAIMGGLAIAIMITVGTLGVSLGSGSWAFAILLFLFLLGTWLYYIAFEGLRRGQTPGKRIVGIRVVSDTGHAVTFGAAAVRNLLRLADFLPPPYFTGAALAALHPRGKRLGDMVAGTVVVWDRPMVAHPPRTAAGAAAAAPEPPPFAELPEFGDAEFRLLSQFEARHHDLPPETSARLAERLAGQLRISVPAQTTPVQHLLEMHGRELARRQGRLGAVERRGVLRFAEYKEPRWEEFRALADRAARRGLNSFSANELPEFAARYREVAADLARARTYRADPATVARLERLVTAGHNALYRDDRHTWRQIWVVLARECPAAVIQTRWYVTLAFLLFMAPAVAGFAMLRERPALAAEILPDAMLQRAEAGAARQAAGQKYYTAGTEERPIVASQIIGNNIRVAMACFAGGIFLGVGSLVLLAFNGLVIGASAGHFANVGLLNYLLEFIVGHGVLELFAIWVAGAAGFLLGRAVVAPGTLSRSDALLLSGRTAVRMIGVTVILLLVAGTIEGFVSAGGGNLGFRAAVSAGSVVFLVLYLANGARSLAASRASESPAPRLP